MAAPPKLKAAEVLVFAVFSALKVKPAAAAVVVVAVVVETVGKVKPAGWVVVVVLVVVATEVTPKVKPAGLLLSPAGAEGAVVVLLDPNVNNDGAAAAVLAAAVVLAVVLKLNNNGLASLLFVAPEAVENGCDASVVVAVLPKENILLVEDGCVAATPKVNGAVAVVVGAVVADIGDVVVWPKEKAGG